MFLVRDNLYNFAWNSYFILLVNSAFRGSNMIYQISKVPNLKVAT